MILGEYIKSALKRAGHTQVWLGQQVGVSHNAVSHWCNSNNLRTSTIRKIHAVFPIPEFAALLGEEPQEGSKMSYKAVIEHQIKPGKYQEVLEWIRAKKEQMNHREVRRFIALTGDVHRFYAEIEMETPLDVRPWVETDWGHEHLFSKVEFKVLKLIDV